MRISDWSSDVCSSDLKGYRRPLDVDHQRLPARRLPVLAAARQGHIGICPSCSRSNPHPRTAAAGAYPRRPEPPRHIRMVHDRSEEHTSELQSLMRISYAVFCLKKKKNINHKDKTYIKNQRQALTKHRQCGNINT